MSVIQVCVIDDSVVIRQTIVEIIDKVPDMEILYVAEDVNVARSKMAQQWPDVILLDIEMPGMDGLRFLSEIMQQKPTPVVICSALIEGGPKATMKAVGLGAVEIISKPSISGNQRMTASGHKLIASIRAAAKADAFLLKKMLDGAYVNQQNEALQTSANQGIINSAAKQQQLIVLGSATGGAQALELILPALSHDTCAILVVHHIQEQFVRALATHLDTLCEMHVKEAETGDVISKGNIYLAGGEKHIQLQVLDSAWVVRHKDGPKVNQQRPSIDVLLRSVATIAGAQAMGGVLTGDGTDGAAGLLKMQEAGAVTFVQAQETCLVDDMPVAALRRGGTSSSIPLQDIFRQIMMYSA